MKGRREEGRQEIRSRSSFDLDFGETQGTVEDLELVQNDIGAAYEGTRSQVNWRDKAL
jgi:hypothetical protein